MEYIEEVMPPETPLAFGLHPNAEVGFKLREGGRFLRRHAGAAASGGRC